MDVLMWLSSTAPAVWGRESESIWAYPTILTLHTIGLALLVGFASAIDFRVLGYSPGLPLAPLGRFFRYVWIGFWINALSGAWLLVMTPAKVENPAFLVKITCVALGVVTLWWLKRDVLSARVAGDGPGVSVVGRILAGASLLLWAAAIVAGRLMAYVSVSR